MRRARLVRTDPQGLTFDRPQQLMTVGRRSVSMAEGPGDNESILRAYLELVAEQRGVRLDQSVLLRRRDVAVLAEFLDLDDADLDGQLAEILQLPAEDATVLRSRFHQHRRATAEGVGMLLDDATGLGTLTTSPGRALDMPTPSVPTLSLEATITDDALARMDAAVEATPPVVVAPEEWDRGRRRERVATAPELEMPHSVTIPGLDVGRRPAVARHGDEVDYRAFQRDLAFLGRGVDAGTDAVLLDS